MRERILVGTLIVVAVLAFAFQPKAPIVVEPRRERTSGARAADPLLSPEPGVDVPLRRNLFRYEDRAAERVATVATRTPVGAPVPLPTVAPVKLVGVLQQSHGLRAALAVEGEVVLAEKGQTIGSYKVLSIDVEDGVVLAAADGAEIRLSPP